ncbi:MAG: transglutaminase-like cysteine peptidase [Candidatus Devosia euplotis]|nr:transglutaminase-like cysteine peptidase [Candidatus Devosia euplotis]
MAGLCKNSPAECRGGGSASIAATPDLLAPLKNVNAKVNRSIRYRPERIDDWAVNPRNGDCEDYALSKRSALVQAGVDASALRIGITTTRRGTCRAGRDDRSGQADPGQSLGHDP